MSSTTVKPGVKVKRHYQVNCPMCDSTQKVPSTRLGPVNTFNANDGVMFRCEWCNLMGIIPLEELNELHQRYWEESAKMMRMEVAAKASAKTLGYSLFNIPLGPNAEEHPEGIDTTPRKPVVASVVQMPQTRE